MYTLTKKEEKGLQFLELTSFDQTCKAKLCLHQGGRLSNLMLKGIDLLANFDPATYKDNYASSILFPFVNRIKNGKFTYNSVNHVLECNEVDKNNALHGLVYDKNFTLIESDLTSNYGSVKLQYTYAGTCEGFPFKFDMLLTYKLDDHNLSVSVEVNNTGDEAFPFTLGWHPYFMSKNLNKSTLNFEASTKFLFDEQQIITGKRPFDIEMPFQLKDVSLDDGYTLESNMIEFSTPEYDMNISSTSNQNYLQLYTPSTLNVIAIEPMTGAADSFNNKIGLQILNPGAKHNVTWTIILKNHKDNTITNQLIT